MKKHLFIAVITLVTLASCTLSTTSEIGAKNACDFALKQVPGLQANIKSVEAIGQDSVLTDIQLSFDCKIVLRAGTRYLNEEISREDFRTIIKDYEQVLNDVEDSWLSKTANDSLRQLEKYSSLWRKVYCIRVTFTNTDTKEFRVLMDSDGLTPRMTESQFSASLQNYESVISKAYSNL